MLSDFKLFKEGATMNHFYKSVLNTVENDFRRFNELKAHAKQLALICEDGEQFVKGFIQVIGDIWFAFNSNDVLLVKEKMGVNPYQAELIEHLLALEDYKKWKMYTQGDDLLSVLTTITIGEQLLCFIKQDEKVKKSTYERKIAERKKQFAENNLDEINVHSKIDMTKAKMKFEVNQKILASATAEIESVTKFGLQKIVAFKERLISTIVQASSQVNKKQQAIVSLSTIDGRKIEHVPLKDQLKLADAIAQNKVLNEIAEMAGRFKKIAKKKMKTFNNQTMERKAITIGNEVSRLLPLEIANYLFPGSRLEFLRRLSESKTFTYDMQGKERRGRGPIIICMDESSSMHSIKAESKAFCFAFLMIAQKQKRDIAIIPFSSDVGEVYYFYKGQTVVDCIIKFSEQFLGGGTNFEKPLRHSLSIIMKSRFYNADVLFVTDGSSFLPSTFVEEFNEVKKQLKFECISIVLMNTFNSVGLSVVQKFSNKVIEVNNLFEAEEVFSL